VLLVSFNAHTCVGDQECFIPRATIMMAWQVRLHSLSEPGEKAAHKRLNPTAANIPCMLLVAAVTAAAVAVSRTSFSFLLLART
jgi:hypothetical protein